MATIKYFLPRSGNIVVTVTNSIGQPIETLLDTEQEAGEYSVQRRASGVACGGYWCRIQVGEGIEVRPMVFIK